MWDLRAGCVGMLTVVLLAGCGSTYGQPHGTATTATTADASRPSGATVSKVTPPPSTFRMPAFGLLPSRRALDVLPPAGTAGSPLPFVEGGSFREHAGGRAFAADVDVDAGVCGDGPAAALSPNRRDLLYVTADRQDRPVLMLLDTDTDHTRVFRRDACSPVWSSTDEIAYITVGHVTPEDDYQGTVRIRHGITGADVARVSGQDDVTIAWAADRLLVIRGGHTLQLISATGRATTVPNLYSGARTGPYDYGESASLIALSPGGRLALLNLLEPVAGYARDVVVLVRTDTARVVSRFLMPNSQQAVGSDGDWSGDHIVTTNETYPGFGTYSPELITFVVRGARVTQAFEQDILDDHAFLDGSDHSYGTQPRYLSSTRKEIGLWFGASFGQVQYVRCDASTGRCAADRGVTAGADPNGFFVTTDGS